MDRDHRSGFEALFRGIAGILQMANDIVVRAGDEGTGSVEVRRSGSSGAPGTINARYGASVRVGVPVAPPRRPVTVRQNARREPIIDDAREPIVDVFDEGDHYTVIAELPGVEQADLDWNVRDGVHLTLRAESADRKYVAQLGLPGLVSEHAAVCSYANGVMELRLWKA